MKFNILFEYVQIKIVIPVILSQPGNQSLTDWFRAAMPAVQNELMIRVAFHLFA